MRVPWRAGLGAIAATAAAVHSARTQVTTRTRDSSGVAIVEHRGTPRDTSWRMASTPMTRIGSASGTDANATFSIIQGAVRLSNGTVVVLTRDDARWFDANGRYLTTAPRKGGGPGELRFANQIVRLAGDSVLVSGNSFADQKDATFTPAGKLAHEELLDYAKFRGLGRWLEGPFGVLPDRSRYVSAEAPELPARNEQPGLLRNFTRTYRVNPSLDARYALGLDGGIEQFGIDLGDRWPYFVVHPFHSRSAFAAGGDNLRVAMVTNPQYVIDLWRPDGRLERSIRRIDGRRAATATDKVAARAQLKANETRYSRKDPATVDRIIGAVPVPDSLPSVRRLFITPDGSVLAVRWSIDDKAPVIYDVFDPRGAFVSVFHMPPRFRVLEFGRDYVLGVRLDDDDVPFVEAYRLIRATSRGG